MSSLYHLRENSSSFGSNSYLHSSDALEPRYLYCGTSTASKWIDSQPVRMRVESSVVSEPKLGSAWLGFGSSFWEKKLGSACHAFHKAWLGSPYLAKKARFSSACSMI